MPHKYDDDLCICKNGKETQEHIYHCYIYSSITASINYEELFGSDLTGKIEISRIIKDKLELRRVLLSAS